VIDLRARITAAPVTPIPAADVIAHTASLAGVFRARGWPVILVQVGAAEGESTPGRIQARQRPGAPRPAGGEEIVDEIRGDGDIIVHKRNWGAFYGTDLDLHLRRRGITQIVLTGIATSIGVESTARAAHGHGYYVTPASDAMTDLNADAHAGRTRHHGRDHRSAGRWDELSQSSARVMSAAAARCRSSVRAAAAQASSRRVRSAYR
jgi:nicotinamidase-related amidase